MTQTIKNKINEILEKKIQIKWILENCENYKNEQYIIN